MTIFYTIFTGQNYIIALNSTTIQLRHFCLNEPNRWKIVNQTLYILQSRVQSKD